MTMTRPLWIALPVLALLAACHSPGDGTTQSETETVPGDDGAMMAPGSMSETGSTVDGTATTTTPESDAIGVPPGGPPAADDAADPEASSVPPSNGSVTAEPPPAK
jgi:hypothetical protein